MHPLLESAFWNVETAGDRLADFSSATRNWVISKPWRNKGIDNAVVGETVWSFEVARVPTRIGGLATEVISSCRRPLDRLITAHLVDRTGSRRGAKFPHVYFPSRPSQSSFEGAVVELESKGVSREVADFLRHLEVFVGGRGEILHHLHSLDVEQKHYPFLSLVNRATAGFSVQDVGCLSGRIVRVGSTRGQHLIARQEFPSMSVFLEQAEKELAPTYAIIDGIEKLVFKAPEDDFEFMTTSLGAEILCRLEPNLAFKLVLPDGTVIGEAEQALRDMHSMTRETLVEFQERFLKTQ